MDRNRKTARTTGVLFIVATVASLLASALEQPVITGADYLTRISDNVTRLSAGGLLDLVAAGTSVGIAISLYPVLKNWSGSLALGAVVFRGMEAVMYTFGVVSMLSLVSVAQRFTLAATANRAEFQAIGDALLGVREVAILAGVIAFALGALMYYSVFYRSRLVPRWLSGWGVAAEFLMLAACLSALFSRSPVTSYTILILPIAVQEMVMAAWLIVKGFRRSELAAEPAPVLSSALAG